MTLFTSLLTAGTNSHQETSENFNGYATDFVNPGVSGAITNTSGVAPMTGGMAVNAQSTPAMSVTVGTGIAWVAATPSSQNSQVLRVRNAATATVTISANTSGSTKYDFLYVKIDGTKAANPAVDSSDVSSFVTSRSSSSTSDNGTPPAYGILLAVITVANAASTITNGNISDSRATANINFLNGSYPLNRSNNGTGTVESKGKIQTGYAAVNGNGTNTVTMTVVFPLTYTNIPIVVASPGGDNASSTAYGAGGNSVQATQSHKVYNITASGFTMQVYSSTGNWSSTNVVFAQWIAMGA